jgi:hypothetical protein
MAYLNYTAYLQEVMLRLIGERSKSSLNAPLAGDYEIESNDKQDEKQTSQD